MGSPASQCVMPGGCPLFLPGEPEAANAGDDGCVRNRCGGYLSRTQYREAADAGAFGCGDTPAIGLRPLADARGSDWDAARTGTRAARIGAARVSKPLTS